MDKDLYVRQLATYINDQVKKGYSIVAIRNFLVNRGYNKVNVDKAIELVYGKKALTINFKQILVLLLVGLIVGGILLLVFSLNGKEKLSEEFVFKPEGVFPVEKEIEKVAVVPIKEEPKVEIIKEEVQRKKIEPESYQSDYSISQVDNLIRNADKNNGLKFCNSIEGRIKDHCFNRLAVFHNESTYCDKIQRIGTRDSCYMTFAFSSNFEICVKIQNQYQRLTCRELGRARRTERYELLSRIVNGTLND